MLLVNEYELDDMQRSVRRARAIAVCAIYAARDPICDNSEDIAFALDAADDMLQSVIDAMELIIDGDDEVGVYV